MNYRLLSLFLIPAALAFGTDNLDVAPDLTMKYMEQRRNWLSEDLKASFSSNVSLSPEEKKLENYLQTFCYHHWNHFLESNLFPPSRNFCEAKNFIENTLLFRILKRMPKGAILHIHADSTGNATWLVKRAVEEKNCYIYTHEDDGLLKWTIRIFPKGKIPAGFQSMSELAEKDPGFVSKVIEMITMSAEDSASVNPWNKFNACFARIEELFYYEPIFRDYYKQAFEAIAEDNVQIVELRAALDNIYDVDGKILVNNEVVNIYKDIVQEVRKKYPHFTLKLIISEFRTKNIEEARHSLERAFKLRADNPDIIIGYDLVGFETTGHSLLYYLDNLLVASANYEKKYGINLPYFFHAGESGWGHDKNPYDAVLLKSKRIGHGFNLVHFPKLLNEIKNQKICVEICPISNQVLGYVKDLRIHPAVGYIKQGVPCVLSPDDPMIFKITGLSYDFWEAIMAWNLNLTDIKQFCINSIVFSSLSEEEKKQAMEIWQKNWDNFVTHILADLQITH